MRKLSVVMLVGVTVALGCTPMEPLEMTAADVSAIEELISEWEVAWEAGDLDAVVATTTEDYFEARADAVVGQAELRELIESFTITYTDVNVTVENLEGAGGLAYAHVSFENRLTNAEGTPRIQTGNALWVLKKDAMGDWRFAAAAWGSRTVDDTGHP